MLKLSSLKTTQSSLNMICLSLSINQWMQHRKKRIISDIKVKECLEIVARVEEAAIANVDNL